MYKSLYVSRTSGMNLIMIINNYKSFLQHRSSMKNALILFLILSEHGNAGGAVEER